MDLNKVMIIGRATTTIDVKTIESTGTAVVNFVVATNRKYNNKEGNTMEEAEYHRCVSYGKWAEVLGEYLHKGKRIYIEWRLRTRKREDAQGVEKYSTEIIVDNFIFLDSKYDTEHTHTENDETDDDVPF